MPSMGGGDVVMIVKVVVVGEKGGPGDRCTVALVVYFENNNKLRSIDNPNPI
jgi:hypothetical protein